MTDQPRDTNEVEPETVAKSAAVPLTKQARRVLGVLIEKAKTTPDNYPLTLAALISGCNQKSNRSPQMDMDDEDTLLALDELRGLGASREVQGSGRATKYRHAAYEWMDVDSGQAAIMAELLLRGSQTIGELRTRASRMYKFDDLKAIQAVLDTLIEKGLVEALSPPGRGQTVSHTLYQPSERPPLDGKSPSSPPATQGTNTKADMTAVDKLIERLDSVNERIESLEQRIGELESGSQNNG